MHVDLQHAADRQTARPRCHSPLTTLFVHGHEQCLACKSNTIECRSGEVCQSSKSAAKPLPQE